jgi:hypothetical protein
MSQLLDALISAYAVVTCALFAYFLLVVTP